VAVSTPFPSSKVTRSKYRVFPGGKGNWSVKPIAHSSAKVNAWSFTSTAVLVTEAQLHYIFLETYLRINEITFQSFIS
jgi:hypothetical protein